MYPFEQQKTMDIPFQSKWVSVGWNTMNFQCFNNSINNNQYKFCHITRLERKYFILNLELYEQKHDRYRLINNDASSSILVEGFSLSW